MKNLDHNSLYTHSVHSFDITLLEQLGVTTEFDSELVQWRCSFIHSALRLELTYSLDTTLSTALYLDDRLISFSYASGLEALSVCGDEIICQLNIRQLSRQLTINTRDLSVHWRDV
ncbi:hypothetical protein NJ69_12080 [Pseudomonas parafulva]|nr:hypothetical protein NJ69_12080 [Pseudomonas parafulva]